MVLSIIAYSLSASPARCWNTLPNAGDGPAAEAALHLDPLPETLRQVTPRDPGPIAVKDSLDKQPIVPRRHTNRPLTAGQEVSDPLPLIVTQPVASHRSAPNTPTGSESKFATRWNPQMTTHRSLNPPRYRHLWQPRSLTARGAFRWCRAKGAWGYARTQPLSITELRCACASALSAIPTATSARV